MAESNRDRVGKVLDLLRDGLALYVMERLQGKYGNGWIEKARQTANSRASLRATLRTALKNDDSFLERADITLLVSLLLDFYNEVFEPQLGQSGRTLIHEIREIRNQASHQQPFRVEDAHRAADSATRLLEMLSAPEAKETQKLRRVLGREMHKLTVEQDLRQQARLIPEPPSMSGLSSWRDVVEPHPDVAAGDYVEAEFMADLSQVHSGDATPEYQDPTEFFQRTYLTESLALLLRQAIQRLHGMGGQPVTQLQTVFGGGKTHSMLALYHVTGGGFTPAEVPDGDRLVDGLGIDTFPTAKRAVFVGTARAPGQPHEVEGAVLRTIWGELAYQIGGVEAYARIAESDMRGTSPGSDEFQKILDDFGPALILIDEYVAFARQLVGKNDLPAGTWEANLSFMQSLEEAVRKSEDSFLVVSLPSSEVEVGGAVGKEVLEQVTDVIGRGDRPWEPATALEGFEIVRRRLFSTEIDHAKRDLTLQAFYQAYLKNPNDFPKDATTAEYRERMESAFPVHPEFFDRLYEDWSTLEKFQRTRGVLRLMAKVIYALWAREDSRPLIMPGSLPLDSAEVRSELMSYLPPGWDAVVDTDVDGAQSRPFQIDKNYPSLGKYGATRRVSRTIFLSTAPSVVAQQARGIEENRIRLGSVLASEPTAPVGDALGRLGEQRTYLYNEGSRWWYDTRPTIDRLVRDLAQGIKTEEVSAEVEKRLEGLRRARGAFAQVHSVAHGPADVPDEREVRLVVLPMSAFHRRGDTKSPGIELGTKILDQRAGGNRTYRNALVFLVPNKTAVEDLQSTIRAHVAWKSVANDTGLNLDDVQRSEIQANIKRTDRGVEARIRETYSLVLVPQIVEPETGQLSWSSSKIPAGDEGIAVRASRKLANDDQLIERWSPVSLQLELDRRKLWREEESLGVQRLWDDLATYPYLPRIQNRSVLEETLAAGVASPDYWGYADAIDDDGRYLGLKFKDLVVRVVVDEHSVIVTPEAAQRQQQEDQDKAEGQPIGPTDDGGSAGGTDVTVPDGYTETAESPRPKRYQGSVTLDPMRIGTQAAEIANEIIAHLAARADSQVEVRLEIQATFDEGVPEDVERTVSENSRTLKFEGFGFEED